MNGDLYMRLNINEHECKRIEDAIDIMEQVAEAYLKTGLNSTQKLASDLYDAISVLKGTLEGFYY